MAIQDYGRYMSGMADLVQTPVNAFMDGQQNARRNRLVDLQAQRMQNDLDDDAEWDAAYARKDWDTLMRIDPQTTETLRAYEQQKAMAGLEPISISRQKIDMAPLQRQENWAAEQARAQRNADRSYNLQAAQEARLSRPQASGGDDEFARYAAMTPEQRELYDRFKGRNTQAKQADGTMSPEVIAARQQDNANVLASIADAEGMAGFFTTGLIGSVMGDLPGSNAYDLRRAVDTVKANIGFDRLTRMREESKTGGALGQVTERELALLQAVIDSLDANQSETQLRVGLARVRQQYERAMSLYEQMKSQQGAPTQGMVPVEERVKGYYGTGQ